jgi:hypothetical protein
MTKNRLAAGIAALMLTAAMLAPTIASAHEAVSPWNNVSTSPFLAVHVSPGLGAWVSVGYDPNGFWINTTTAVSSTSATYWIRTYDKCTSGLSAATTGLVKVTGPNFWVRGSAYCTSSGISQGRAGVSSTSSGF